MCIRDRNLSSSTFSVSTNDLSDNITLLSGDQNISGVKTFGENIIADISGNATSVTAGLTTSSEVTDLSGITDMGSGKIISNTERTSINNISGVPANANYFVNPIATTNVSGIIRIGTNLSANGAGVVSVSGSEYSAGNGLDLSSDVFSIDTNDLSNNLSLIHI